jgi:tetratricopeptide (TPR) repeat protein
MTRHAGTVLLLVGIGCVVSRSAVGQQAFFDEGNRLYQALVSYERILTQGWKSGILYFNIGNAYFKLGELGNAILAYERALRLMPRDDDLRSNLDLARTLTADEITPLPGFWPLNVVTWWVGLLSRSALISVVAGAYLVTTICLVLLVLRRGTSTVRWVRWAVFVGAGIIVVFGINLAVRELRLGQAEEAIVMAAEVGVQSAPSDDADLQIFTIHEGTKVRIDRASDEWLEVVLEEWVRAEVLERI